MENVVWNLIKRHGIFAVFMAHKTSKLGLGTARKQMVVSCNTNQELVDLMNSFT